jgi:hypothetical protein
MKRVPVNNLDDFGLTLQTLSKLAPRTLLKIRADVQYPTNVQSLVRLRPTERARRIHSRMERSAQQILRAWPLGPAPQVVRSESGRPEKIVGTIALKDLRRLLRVYDIRWIWIEGVGRRKAVRAKPVLNWYAVLARFAIQIEGRTSGLQDLEDRTLVVKAFSESDAIRRLRKEFRGYGEPYLNRNNHLVRWMFEQVLEVKDLVIDSEIDPKGTEVYSSFHSRRMKPKYEWHPNRKRPKE